jgi:hypothetical protein
MNITIEHMLNELDWVIKPTISPHMYFLILCDSVSNDTHVNKQIKDIIISNYILTRDYIEFFGDYITNIYIKILKEIWNRQLSDINIVFTDNTFLPCLKAVLRTIPYFDMMFNDTHFGDTLNVMTDPLLTKILIRLAYNSGIDFVFTDIPRDVLLDNYIELFYLMDSFSMEYHFQNMLSFGKKNIITIIRRLRPKKKFKKIKKLQIILLDISDDNIFDESINSNKQIADELMNSIRNAISF